MSRHKQTPEEARIHRSLRQRTCTDWYEAIKKLRTPSVRTQVALIVWWDYFADRHKGQESKHLLDRWRAQWTPQLHVWPKILCKALVKVGFPPGEALARSLILRRVDFGGKGSASPTVGPPRHLPRMKISI